MPDPDHDEIRAYCRGALPGERAAAVEAWLAALPETEAERVLIAAGAGDDARGALHGAATPETGFVTDLARGRLRPGMALGEGGMAVVSAAHDRILERTVALKVLRPRRADEALEAYHLREAAFRREAAITAGLEHPAIPPVHDVGRSDGLPAFAMQRLEGRTLDAVVRAGDLSLADRVEVLLRVAEAVGYAHSRGVVHRDLTPRNILIGGFGAVHVLDWGLAARIGESSGVLAGTPTWMAPELFAGASADPRQDVHALGALLRFSVAAPLPRGLEALARHCLQADPAARYPDAGAVADELRRWQAEGITVAQEATRWELAWLRLRRSPRVLTGLAVGIAALILVGGGWWFQERQARRELDDRLARIAATTALDRTEAVTVAIDEVRAILAHRPDLVAAQALEARLVAARDLAEGHERAARVQARLRELLGRTRTRGPWADQVQAWREAIRDAGLTMDPERTDEDARRLRGHPQREAIAESLAFLWRAEKERGADFHAERTAALLAEGGPTPGWQALGRLFAISRFDGHEPVFCVCDNSAGALDEPGPAAVAIALFGPEPRLTAAARATLRTRPGDFWPLLASARASLADGDLAGAESAGLIAVGAEPDSLLPHLVLGYVALARHDPAALAEHAGRARAADPDNNEALALQAVALAQQGRKDEAQRLVDRIPSEHLQRHRDHPVGHPMERSVQALVELGLHL